ncbi:hypothetical protein GOHSU_54_00190 [Gordonia hirsuta DSM 44140 = NBRC 16056]|uniref:Metallo-beta-lactamase domain-containing protein n=1 Tax=Gordonia hirsuta DSM 44140 = NBRC 16056 TaxID=1121927 RepID=L7LDK5_9ACTN|nr:hypothetical protein [Gordonia hirsuta]GAC58841.1 hypothetical protein GOHSU_54_00190 [Gordonia hirsuta DSM 44140 = NBRC 16056]
MIWLCVTCGNEYPDTEVPPATCVLCNDERQYVPQPGQQWTALSPEATSRVQARSVEPGLTEFSLDPPVGIGQRTFLVHTEAGNILWEPPGFVGTSLIDHLRAAGGISGIVASHPHLVGASVSLSHAFGGVPVWQNSLDRRWITRPDPVHRFWEGRAEVAPGVTLVCCGGHFPGSAVLHLADAAHGRGALLTGDTMMVGRDRASVSFMRSYPNLIPLSERLVRQIAGAVESLPFDRLYGAFGLHIETDAARVVRDSAARYIGWLTDQIRDPDEPGSSVD